MNDLLRNAVKTELVREPSKGFTDKVMSGVFSMEILPKEKPLISKWGWISIGAVFLAFTMYVYIARPVPSETSDSFVGDFMSRIDFSSVFSMPNVNLYLVAAAFLAVGILTFFDQLLFRKR